MAGFRKAKAEQAALKMGMYGPAGSGKTLTALLLAEGLTMLSKKRIACVDTERGTDFYVQAVPERTVHPEAFDLDALYTRSITETLAECRKLDPATYGAVVLDSMTHLWEAAIAAYGGNKTRAGTIPMHAWGAIKKPYKELMNLLLNSTMHVFILGRQGIEYGEEDGGELRTVGYKMKAEGETAYEPHILIRMEAVKPFAAKGKKPDGKALAVPTAFVEKDRSGILYGQAIPLPNFDNICRPLQGLLGQTQARMDTDEETAAADADALEQQDRNKELESKRMLEEFRARFLLAKCADELKEIEQAITPAIKKRMLTAHVNELRDACGEARRRIAGGA